MSTTETRLHGTWRLVGSVDRNGKHHSSSFHAEYSFNPDGSASFNLPDGSRLPMQWNVAKGRLLISANVKSKGKGVEFEMPSENRLVIRGLHGSTDQAAVFERVPEKEVRSGWSVWIEPGAKQVTYQDDERTSRFRIEFSAGGVVIHTYEWLDTNGKKHNVTPDVGDVVVKRTIAYLEKAGWRNKIHVRKTP